MRSAGAVVNSRTSDDASAEPLDLLWTWTQELGLAVSPVSMTASMFSICRHGQKLDFARIQALLYTIGLVYDKTAVSQTTVPSYTDHMAVR